MGIRKLVLASAGAGKTKEIINEAKRRFKADETVLIITYTQNNQTEISRRLSRELKAVPDNIRLKGWFSFLLDDLIRPYQSGFFPMRIENIRFNKSNPHKIPNTKFQIRGRQEHTDDKKLNPKHFLNSTRKLAHTAFLSKLAFRISEEPETCHLEKIGRKKFRLGYAFKRVVEIYDVVIIDEVQDLTGWDYGLLKKLSELTEIDIICVGDFRQTVYLTHHDKKSPDNNADKISTFEEMGFAKENRFVSYRCAQPICDFADEIHASLKLPSTVSLADYKDAMHVGVFRITNEQIEEYCAIYNPTILRNMRNVEKEICEDKDAFNFGESKGLQFNRTLIIPTPRQTAYLEGDDNAFVKLKTDKEINRFYVAITRAKYSVAILHNSAKLRNGIAAWRS